MLPVLAVEASAASNQKPIRELCSLILLKGPGYVAHWSHYLHKVTFGSVVSIPELGGCCLSTFFQDSYVQTVLKARNSCLYVITTGNISSYDVRDLRLSVTGLQDTLKHVPVVCVVVSDFGYNASAFETLGSVCANFLLLRSNTVFTEGCVVEQRGCFGVQGLVSGDVRKLFPLSAVNCHSRPYYPDTESVLRLLRTDCFPDTATDIPGLAVLCDRQGCGSRFRYVATCSLTRLEEEIVRCCDRQLYTLVSGLAFCKNSAHLKPKLLNKLTSKRGPYQSLKTHKVTRDVLRRVLGCELTNHTPFDVPCFACCTRKSVWYVTKSVPCAERWAFLCVDCFDVVKCHENFRLVFNSDCTKGQTLSFLLDVYRCWRSVCTTSVKNVLEACLRRCVASLPHLKDVVTVHAVATSHSLEDFLDSVGVVRAFTETVVSTDFVRYRLLYAVYDKVKKKALIYGDTLGLLHKYLFRQHNHSAPDRSTAYLPPFRDFYPEVTEQGVPKPVEIAQFLLKWLRCVLCGKEFSASYQDVVSALETNWQDGDTLREISDVYFFGDVDRLHTTYPDFVENGFWPSVRRCVCGYKFDVFSTLSVDESVVHVQKRREQHFNDVYKARNGRPFTCEKSRSLHTSVHLHLVKTVVSLGESVVKRATSGDETARQTILNVALARVTASNQGDVFYPLLYEQVKALLSTLLVNVKNVGFHNVPVLRNGYLPTLREKLVFERKHTEDGSL